MKKLTTLLIAVMALSANVAFAKNYGSAGCGLGSIVMGTGGSQVLAATTNATSYSQTFGITSGTSNCTDEGTVAKGKEVPLFIEANQYALANDVARGSGETLANLSQVMGCENPGVLATTLQKNYSVIFPNEKVSSTQVTESIVGIVKKNQTLSTTCKI